MNEPQVGQRHEYIKRKREYYHIIIFPERIEILHQERRGEIKIIAMGHFNGILFHKFEPANKQHTNQPTRACNDGKKVGIPSHPEQRTFTP